MSLEDAAKSRKERLLALRKRREGEVPEEMGDKADDANGEKPASILRHRNYDQETGGFKGRTKEDDDRTETVEKLVSGVSEQVLAEEEARREEDVDLLNLAPKRPNWDLKRDLDRKLQKLDKKTNEAMVILLRKRLLSQKGNESSLAEAVAVQQQADATLIADEAEDSP